uniref:Uncharacterized protein n=1 Tax=Mycena chlorophos TaxID=658473 RepID=A0ABQ0M4G2_MYCCL|nr:predicted protein [Mycena chlorophos]
MFGVLCGDASHEPPKPVMEWEKERVDVFRRLGARNDSEAEDLVVEETGRGIEVVDNPEEWPASFLPVLERAHTVGAKPHRDVGVFVEKVMVVHRILNATPHVGPYMNSPWQVPGECLPSTLDLARAWQLPAMKAIRTSGSQLPPITAYAGHAAPSEEDVHA